ncbi:unnamed protein product [Schistocephalus solidus]|uniref:Peptidyl-prolyl cis-trans isomerase n=1 Tax=Schistocephalus solidus TaxID=70667 RepID=A0A3P7CIT3_SCHSO|nr:unnamed protein product [Schistocephalus solidus]
MLKDLHETLPKVFDEPKIKGVYEFEWIEFLNSKKKELKGEYWAFDGVVICFCDKKPIGNCDALRDWALKNYGLDEYRPYTFYEMLAHDAYRDELVRRDVSHYESLINLLPKTCQNFASLCRSDLSPVPKNEIEVYTMAYKDTIFHRLVPEGWIQGGDENFSVKHDKRGILSMANKGRHTNASQFFITFKPSRWMDFRYVAFGPTNITQSEMFLYFRHVLEGWNTLEAMEHVPTVNERPVQEIKIAEVKVLAGKDIHEKLR